MLPVFDNDTSVVDGIITRKRSDKELLATEVRQHPEHPSLYQYLVLTEDYEEASESDKIIDKFMVTETGDDSESSDSVSSSDDDSSDDDDGNDEDEGRKGKRGSKSKKPRRKSKSKVR